MKNVSAFNTRSGTQDPRGLNGRLPLKLNEVGSHPPSERGAFAVRKIENRVTRIGVSIAREVIESPLFKYRQHALTDMPVRNNTDDLMFIGILQVL